LGEGLILGRNWRSILDLSGFDRPITTLRSAVPAEIKLEKYQ
jgi:hypothetical protein